MWTLSCSLGTSKNVSPLWRVAQFAVLYVYHDIRNVECPRALCTLCDSKGYAVSCVTVQIQCSSGWVSSITSPPFLSFYPFRFLFCVIEFLNPMVVKEGGTDDLKYIILGPFGSENYPGRCWRFGHILCFV